MPGIATWQSLTGAHMLNLVMLNLRLHGEKHPQSFDMVRSARKPREREAGLGEPRRYRKTPLFDRFLRFNVRVEPVRSGDMIVMTTWRDLIKTSA